MNFPQNHVTDLPLGRGSTKILIISFFTEWVTHFGTELEIAERHIENGDVVDLLWCDGAIGACRLNPTAIPEKCLSCSYRRFSGLQLIPKLNKATKLSDWISDEAIRIADAACAHVNNIDTAKAFRYDGHDLGWGALSSTIHETRDAFIERDESKTMLKQLTRASVITYEAVKSYLISSPAYDFVYIFNGRHANTRAAYRAVKAKSRSTTLLHERGSDMHKFTLVPNDMLHSHKSILARVNEAWDAQPDIKKKLEAASKFYHDRSNGAEVGWLSFTAQQKKSLLPENWSEKQRRITIFNSSEDEWVAIGDEWSNKLYRTQSEGIERLVRDLRISSPNTHIYLRMHPNLADVVNSDTNRLRAISSENFTLIDSTSPISTYAMMHQSDVVLSFGSTVGIEASFWGVPSVVAAPAMYDGLGGTYKPDSHEDLIKMLCDPLVPLDKSGAYKYGYYMGTAGIPFTHWKSTHFFRGFYKQMAFDHDTRLPESKLLLALARRFGPQSLAVKLALKFMCPPNIDNIEHGVKQ